MSNCKIKRDININIHDAWERYQQCSVMPMQEILSNAFASGSVFGANISCNKIIAWIKDNIEDYLDYDVSMEEVRVDEKFYEDMKMAIKVK